MEDVFGTLEGTLYLFDAGALILTKPEVTVVGQLSTRLVRGRSFAQGHTQYSCWLLWQPNGLENVCLVFNSLVACAPPKPRIRRPGRGVTVE